MVILNPADGVEARAAVKAAIDYEGPCYLRFGRLAVNQIFDENYNFEIGKGVEIKPGKDATIIATGLMVDFAMEAAKNLEEDGIDVRVVNMATIKPIDKDIIIKAAKETGAIVTAEEHNVIGGLGSAVAEVLCENEPCIMKRIGTQDVFGRSGTPAELFKEYGLTAADIEKNVKQAIYEKNN